MCRNLRVKILLCISLFSSMVCFGMQQSRPRDPYLPIRYSEAFEQKDIWKKNEQLMEHLGCSHNVFDESASTIVAMPHDSQAYEMVPAQSLDLAAELESYQKECQLQLNKARWYALAEPGIYAGTEMAMMSVGAIAALSLLGKDSMGGSFAGFAAIFDSLRLMRGTIESGYNLISRPDNPLEFYEDRFAQNKCFIPRELWPKIVRALISARQNEYSREQHTNFLNFALGFTTYKPLPALCVQLSRDDIKRELSWRIDNFFKHYNHVDSFLHEIGHIHLNIAKFVDQLFDKESKVMPRYIYLYGMGGIGKTYFVSLLSQWINELLPQAVNCETIVVNSGQELEGTAERPGALLKVLYNQLVCEKRGSIVVFDEASWFNNPALIPSVKRTFNVDQSKLCTDYLGNGADGAGIELTIPPMLVFVASNDTIQDEALASRFDIVHYPSPSKDALIDHALAVTQRSVELQRRNIIVDEGLIRKWVEGLDQKDLNFRSVAGAVEVEFMTYAKKNNYA